MQELTQKLSDSQSEVKSLKGDIDRLKIDLSTSSDQIANAKAAEDGMVYQEHNIITVIPLRDILCIFLNLA